jgi:hypothetical protein
MSTLFSNTIVAKDALYADFKFKPYYHVGFHLDAITSFLCHIARTIYDLAATLLRITALSFSVISIFGVLWAPVHAWELLDDLTATVIAAFTVAIHPVIVVLRTLSSVFYGYERNVDDALGAPRDSSDIYKEEDSDLNLATTLYSCINKG